MIDSLKQKRVLVTGGCGFIGSHLVEQLVAQKAHVTALDNLQAGRWVNLDTVAGVVQIIEADICDKTLVTHLIQDIQPQIVFHLAANASVPKSVEDPSYDFATNCYGTFILLNALRQHSQGICEKFILASSGAVYGEPASFPIFETDPLRPISPYGASKVAAETETQMFGYVYGLPVVIARLFNTYGPRMARFVVLDFLRKLSQNPAVLEVLGTGQQVRDFTFVSDAVNGLLLLAVLGQNGEAYNISSGVSHSVTELAHTLLNILGLSDLIS